MTYTERALQLRPVIEEAAQSLDDATAITAKELYPKWESLCNESHKNHTVKLGFKFDHDRTLYKTAQPEYTFVKEYVPGTVGTESLFTQIDETHAGTIDDPIPAKRNMEYTYFLYYLDPEDGLTYLCQYGDTQITGTVTLQYLPHELPSYFKLVTV